MGYKIIVEAKHQPTDVKNAVQRLFEERSLRTTGASMGVFSTSVILGAGEFARRSEQLHPLAKFLLVPGSWLLAFTGVERTASFFAFRNKLIVQKLEDVGLEVKKHGLIESQHAYRYPSLANLNGLRESHPFFSVNRKGDIVLIPGNRLQRAIYKMQHMIGGFLFPATRREKL